MKSNYKQEERWESAKTKAHNSQEYFSWIVKQKEKVFARIFPQS